MFSNRFLLIMVMALGTGLRIFVARDEYLHQWDERFHALVAKNLIEDPLRPTLYKHPVEQYDYCDWTRNHIWLSKPPVPLWLMAISIHAFGLHEFAVRVPGIIAAILATLLTYYIARRFLSDRQAIFASLLYAIHPVISDLAAGRVSSDGVESVFLFFIVLSCYFVFLDPPGKPRTSSYLLTGAFSGLAVLSKWQPGLLPIVLLFVFHFEPRSLARHFRFTFLAFLVSAVIFGGWILHCFIQFETEAQYMMRALFTPFVDESINPDGKWYSYLTDFGNYFGYTTFLLTGVFAYSAFKQKSCGSLALLIWALLPLFIFSMAEVKRGTYLMISAPAIFIIISSFLTSRNSSNRRSRFYSAAGIISVISILILTVEKLHIFNPKDTTPAWSAELKARQYAPGKVIYNEPHYIEAMFYHNIVAYDGEKPSEHSVSTP
jgi:4-amino-4-deoxy-L-arabinose transferase